MWIGEEGMTPEEYLRMEEWNEEDRRQAWEEATAQDRRETFDEMPEDLRKLVTEEMFEEPPAKWDALPEWFRKQMKRPLEVEPGEFVGVEGGEGGIQVPKIGYEYLDGLYAVENMRAEMYPQDYAELHADVSYIRAAKQGRVRVEVAWDLEFKPYHGLTDEDKLFTKATTEDGLAMVYLGPRYQDIPLGELTPEAVDDHLLENLEFRAAENVSDYVVEDSESVRAALEQRLAADPGKE